MAIDGRHGHQGGQRTRQPLHVCASCNSKFVHPIEWEAAGRNRWTVSLRCPNCEWTGSGTFAQELVDSFDDELDSGSMELARELRELSLQNMADYAERFIGALRAGAILPDDF